MKNFNSFEDFSNQKINEQGTVAPFYDSVNQMNAILASDEVASKMEMMSIDSMTYEKNSTTWVIKSKDRPLFIVKVTLKAKGGQDMGKYTVSNIVKVVATPQRPKG